MSNQDSPKPASDTDKDCSETAEPTPAAREYGGPKGKEPTRYGDWEKNGRCSDF